MSSIIQEIANIEKELLALTGNQPPNPAQIGTFQVTHTTAVNDESKTIMFDDGIDRFIQTYVLSGSANVFIVAVSGHLEIHVTGTAPITYTAVSVGSFSLA